MTRIVRAVYGWMLVETFVIAMWAGLRWPDSGIAARLRGGANGGLRFCLGHGYLCGTQIAVRRSLSA